MKVISVVSTLIAAASTAVIVRAELNAFKALVAYEDEQCTLPVEINSVPRSGAACVPTSCIAGQLTNCLTASQAASALFDFAPYLLVQKFSDPQCRTGLFSETAVVADGECHVINNVMSEQVTINLDGSVTWIKTSESRVCAGTPHLVIPSGDLNRCVNGEFKQIVYPGDGPTRPASTDCGDGETEMSVEGVPQIFCISGQACVADVANGQCPGAQPNLPFGAYCAKVRTDVYGCRPYVDAMGTRQAEHVPSDAPLNCAGNAGGDTPVAVEGAGVFCARQPVCSGPIQGNCPTEASGLTQPVQCKVLRNAPRLTYGCTVNVGAPAP